MDPCPESPAYLETLNPEQRCAVTHDGETPLLVIAGAGSGKTNTLAYRVAHLIVGGADPRRILLLTFSRRAAVEMGRRVERIVARVLGEHGRGPRGVGGGGSGGGGLTWSGTFHAVGARLLRAHAGAIGLDPGFTIHDREDSADLLNLVRHEQGLSRTERRFPTKRTCLAIYSRAVNAEAPLEQVLAGAFPWCADWEQELRGLFAGYVEAKQAQGVLDYDDLLLYWAQMMTEPSLAETVGQCFDQVLVDEYQDTNRLQASILMGLKPDGRGLTVVGDDAQSIYAFRAATVRNILEFPDAFSPPARVVTLERNYRSTRPILDAANAVIALAEEGFAKSLWSERASAEQPALVTLPDEAEQARYLVARVLENRENGMSLKSQAVLFRTSHHSAALELELVRRNIPFVKFGGLKFLDTAHVKDLLACLRWAENPRDRIAGFRVVQLLPGIGPAIAGRILERVATAADPCAALESFRPPARAEADWEPFTSLFRQLAWRAAGWPDELEAVRGWYRAHLERLYDDAPVRDADLAQLCRIAAGAASRQRFLTELTLDPPDAVSDEAGVPLLDEDYLILSTIHSAKGQEWSAVFLLNAVDGCLPSDLATGSAAEIEEERRLLYVAMTRARDQLEILLPQRFYTHQQARSGDRHLYASRTRFIPTPLLDRFECRTWPTTRAGTDPARPSPPRVQLDVAARMRGMWG